MCAGISLGLQKNPHGSIAWLNCIDNVIAFISSLNDLKADEPSYQQSSNPSEPNDNTLLKTQCKEKRCGIALNY